jgi:glucose 1-dehydrogenase
MAIEINLSEKRALVTGGNTGIGAEICRTLAAAGARVAIDYVAQPEKAAALADELNQRYGATCARTFPGDVSQESAAEALVVQAVDWLGGLDVLVNNAGVESVHAALDMPLAEWDRVLGVNLRGAFITSRCAARSMIAQGNGGAIVNVQSIHDTIARKGATHYCVSKAGLAMLTKTLALEWAEYGIRVVGVSPGAIQVERNQTMALQPPDPQAFYEQFNNDWIPTGRFGQPQEVAQVVAFAASELASYMTGNTLYVDGAYAINLVRYDQRRWQR